MQTAITIGLFGDAAAMSLVHFFSPEMAKYLLVFQLASATGLAAAVGTAYYSTVWLDEHYKKNPLRGRDSEVLGFYLLSLGFTGFFGAIAGGVGGFSAILYLFTRN